MEETDRFFREVAVSAAGVRFSVWAPTADAVWLRLYTTAEGGTPYRTEPMYRSDDGRWLRTLPPDVVGRFYEFQACVGGQWRTPSAGLFAEAVGINGVRGAIVVWEDSHPTGWEDDAAPPFAHPSEAVVYELHHRDFSVSPDSGMRHKGKFLALTERGTRTPGGCYSGLSHLVELGVTHVHLLPSFDFASVDERVLDLPQYNWGYDPLHYNVPEGSYATDAADPVCRVREFKEMVMALHRSGLRVVMDVVYNHTYTVDGSNFERLVPGYFFRKQPDGTWANGSGCGNETASEREMMRRYMIESVCYWTREYHIDGFRFDVMGLHDLQTMQEIRDALRAIDPSILLYGEGWSCHPAQLPVAQCALKGNMARLEGVSAFGDELRDGVRGPWTKEDEGGFLCCRSKASESVRYGIVGGVWHPQISYDKVNYSDSAWAAAPWQVVNYVSCHDDLCLTDRLEAVAPHLSSDDRYRLYKIALALVFTSQGIPFMFAGDEMMRTKWGDRNSYKSPDSINAIRWRSKDLQTDLFHWCCELIRLRRTHPAFRLRTAEEVRNALLFLAGNDDTFIAYKLRWQTCVYYLYFNVSPKGRKVWLPSGDYRVLARDGDIAVDGLGRSRGGRIRVAPRSMLLLQKDKGD